MVILNFSHPLSDTALKQIQDLYMGEYLQEVSIPVQVDLNQPLPPQIESIYSQAEPYLDTGVALVVVPSLAVIAALLMSRLSATTPGVIHLVVLKRDPASFGGQFVLAGTVAY